MQVPAEAFIFITNMTTKTIYKPQNDNEFLEQISFIRFVSGFRYSVVDARCPQIRKAFRNFNVKKLAAASDKDVEKFMAAKGMIRNRGKINDVIKNAKLCAEIEKEHGTVLQWIGGIKKQHKEDPLLSSSLQEELRRFHGIGEMTSGWVARLHMAKKSYITYEMP